MFEHVATPQALVAVARERAAAQRRAEADVLLVALEWAVAHPARDDGADAAVFHSAWGDEPIAGDRCPEVAEFCVAELGAALGLSTTAAKKLIGHALELAHRLPRLWRRVSAGEVPAWRARAVAEATIHASPALPAEAVEWVDRQVAPFVERVGAAQVERLVEQAKKNWSLLPEVDPEDPWFDVAVDGRYARVEAEQISFGGTMRLEAELDIADAHDLEQALRAGAESLKVAGSRSPLDVRRSQALGELARAQTSFDLSAVAVGEEVRVPRQRAARRVDLHLHFEAMVQPDGTLGVSPTGFLENHRRLVLLEQVQRWVRDTHTEVRVTPVVDLAEQIEVEGYVPSARLRRQVELRDAHCVFPWCTRAARACDLDHVQPYDHAAEADGRAQPGTTSSANLATLCRSHHRLKTHGGWRLRSPAPGVFVWVSPCGQRFRRDRHGTLDLSDIPVMRPPEQRRPLP